MAVIFVIILKAIIAFFGCCGSNKENYCMLMTFAVLLFVIFLVELGGGIAAYVERGRIQGYLGHHMNDSLNAYQSNNTSTTGAWDSVQVRTL